MSYYQVCECCKQRAATEKHHRLSQSKWAVKKYGKRIHHEGNIQMLCHTCHMHGVIERFNEREFLEATKEYKD